MHLLALCEHLLLWDADVGRNHHHAGIMNSGKMRNRHSAVSRIAHVRFEVLGAGDQNRIFDQVLRATDSIERHVVAEIVRG